MTYFSLSLWHINRFPVPVSGTSQLVPETGIGFWYQLAWHTRPISATTSIPDILSGSQKYNYNSNYN